MFFYVILNMVIFEHKGNKAYEEDNQDSIMHGSFRAHVH